MAEPPVQGSTFHYQGQSEKITHGPQIAGLLKRVRDNRVLLSVRVPGSDAIFNSLLLEVDVERNFILLDELNPRLGHELACQARQIRVHCQCQGVELSFVCPIDVGQGQRGISFYRATLPDAVNYLQRRSNFRVRVGRHASVPVQLPLGETLEGELIDLSLGGFGASLPDRAELARGQIVESCSIRLPNCDPLTTELEIRFVQRDKQRQILRIGARFRGLDPLRQNLLRRVITQLEREMLRRKART